MGKGRKSVDSKQNLVPELTFPPPTTPELSKCVFLNSEAKNEFDEGEELDHVPLHVFLSTYFGYMVLIAFGHLRDFFGKIFKPSHYAHLKFSNGYAPLVSDFESFYTRRLYHRIRDCWNRPITGVPGREITLLDRCSSDFNKTFTMTGTQTTVLNLASYNYLGFAQGEGPCVDTVHGAIKKYGISLCSSAGTVGTQDLHRELEQTMARFVGQEDAVIFSMGYATNSTNLPALAGKGTLIISDELNHASLVFGCRLSGAAIRVFKHNNMSDLEKVVRSSISQGQPRTHRPWKKIIVIVEGLYSMEGSILDLVPLVELKRRYKFYLYIDEAHSIGAIGPRGRGVCDYWGVDPGEVDILMGTFTKSFGSAGGYIAGKRDVIEHLRIQSHAVNYGETMSPIVAAQALSALRTISGEDLQTAEEGQRRLQAIHDNSRYFHAKLKEMGAIVVGSPDSPVIPLMLFNPAKIPAFSRECLRRGLAVVVVGYPATPIVTSRVRFCISAAHTKQDLDKALAAISDICETLLLKVSRH
jgi:serine palmitoyltransferase